MSILETQLSTWANQGSVKMSSKTYESVKNCIDNINWKPDITYDNYLHKMPADNKKNWREWHPPEADSIENFSKIKVSTSTEIHDKKPFSSIFEPLANIRVNNTKKWHYSILEIGTN